MRAYVLAGGASRRFGRDKALAEFGGETMLVRMCKLAEHAAGNVKIVAAGERYKQAGYELLQDRWPGEGPLGGILTALVHTKSMPEPAEWNLILGCDIPFLARDWLAFLCERARRSEADVVVPQSGHGLEPLCACWRTSATAALQAEFDRGVRKVTDALKRLRTEVLDERVWKRFDSAGRLFWNMNTPADYEEALRMLREGHA